MSAGSDGMDPDDLLAAEYVLGVLPHAERVVFAMRLEHSPALRERVDFWEARLMPLGEGIEEVRPAAAVQRALEHRLFGAEAPPRHRFWNAAGLWRWISVVSVAATAALAVLVFQLVDRPAVAPGQPAYVAELTGESGLVRMLALFEPDTGVLRVNRTEGDAAQARVFQLWVIADDNPPVSLGLLPQDTSGAVQVPPDLRGALRGGILAISDEPAGGSPTGQPTGAVLALGRMAPL